jgi:hypothetical protein
MIQFYNLPFNWGLGIGNWGLGIRDWGFKPRPNPVRTSCQYPVLSKESHSGGSPQPDSGIGWGLRGATLNLLRLYLTNVLLFLTLFNFIHHLSELRQQILK